MRKIILALALVAITAAPSFAASATTIAGGVKAQASMSASQAAQAAQAAGGVKGAEAAKAAAERAK